MSTTYPLGDPIQAEDGQRAQLVIRRAPYQDNNRYGGTTELIARAEFVYADTGEKLPYGVGVRVPGTRRWLTPDSLPEVKHYENSATPNVGTWVTFRLSDFTQVYADDTRAGKTWHAKVRSDLDKLQTTAPELFARMTGEEITMQHAGRLLTNPSGHLERDVLDKFRAVKVAGGDHEALITAFTDALRDDLLNIM